MTPIEKLERLIQGPDNLGFSLEHTPFDSRIVRLRGLVLSQSELMVNLDQLNLETDTMQETALALAIELKEELQKGIDALERDINSIKGAS